MNGCFCTGDIGAITEGVIEKSKIHSRMCTVIIAFEFLFLFEKRDRVI